MSQAEPDFDVQVPEPGQELGAIGSPRSVAPETQPTPEPQPTPETQPTPGPPAPGAKETAEVHLTRVHEVQGTGFLERNYTLYTLQYTLSWLTSPTGECDRRYSEFEAFHGEKDLAIFSLQRREHQYLTVLLVLCFHAMTSQREWLHTLSSASMD